MYRAMMRHYGLLTSVLWMICFVVFVAVACTNIGADARPIALWSGLVILFMVPMAAHTFALMQWFMGGLYVACVGFLVSGAALVAMKMMPALADNVALLPYGQYYWLVMLILSVIVPLVLWLIAVMLLRMGRTGIFGP